MASEAETAKTDEGGKRRQAINNKARTFLINNVSYDPLLGHEPLQNLFF